jgi:molecular chaperone DnaJ
VQINVHPHDFFERDGNDLHCTVPISIVTAALGGKLEVPTLDSRAEIDIPDGTQSGKQFRLRGKGVRSIRSSATGDLYCTVMVETPVKLSRQQKDLLRDFGKTLEGKDASHHHPETSSWLNRAKQFIDEHLK